MSLFRSRAAGSNFRTNRFRTTVAIRKRIATIVIGGTPAFRTVFELTKDKPQKRTVPQIARNAVARFGAEGAGSMAPWGGLRYQKPPAMATRAIRSGPPLLKAELLQLGRDHHPAVARSLVRVVVVLVVR